MLIKTLSGIRIQLRTLIALIVGISVALSISHHLMHFWELSVGKQLLLIATTVPSLTLLANFLLSLIWDDCSKIKRRRWLFVVFPVLAIASFATWYLFKSPVVWHELEIIPQQKSISDQIQLLEIKDSAGAVAKFSNLQNLNGWVIRDGVLLTNNLSPDPIHYSFLGPINKPVTLTFLLSASSGDVQIILDGEILELSLRDSITGNHVIQMNPKYRFGLNGKAVTLLIVFIDLLAFAFLFIFIWLIQEIHQTLNPPEEGEGQVAFIFHRTGLFILLFLSLMLHTINYFSVPLILDVDSPSYLQGAVHWVQYHNLEGVSPFRGPGTTFLFVPILLLFGRNPWGMKLLLHLLAFASVPISYRLGWQLSKKRWFAFLSGLLTALTPDLFFYSNYIMSEIPNIFFVLLFCSLLLSAIETLSLKWIVATLMLASLSVLIRPENTLLLFIGIIFLLIRVVTKWLSTNPDGSQRRLFAKEIFMPVKWIVLATVLAIIPILVWSLHNYKNHGFFGLSNYAGEVLYTGWVYEGEASHIPITDQTSPAVHVIQDAYWNGPASAQGNAVPTGWEIYPFLIQDGYTSQQAFSILKQAAIDSIKKDYRLTLKVITVKIRDSFRPGTTATPTIPLSSEIATPGEIKSRYFDEEKSVFPLLVLIQRKIYSFLEWHYAHIYPMWAWFCVGAMILCVYRTPFIMWGPIAFIALTRVLIPDMIGLSHWRPAVSAIVLMQICALAGLQSLVLFSSRIFGKPGQQ